MEKANEKTLCRYFIFQCFEFHLLLWQNFFVKDQILQVYQYNHFLLQFQIEKTKHNQNKNEEEKK